MDIRQRIDALLVEKGWGRKTLSREMGMSLDFARMFLEKPGQQMGHENLVKCAIALGVTTDYLLYGLAHEAGMLTPDEILAELRLQIDAKLIKQVAIASKMNIPASRVAEMRAGKRRIQPHEMAVLAALLGMTTQDGVISASFNEVMRISVLGKVAAGVWLEQSQTRAENDDYIAYDKLAGDANTIGLFAVVTEGDSMNLAFPANAVLICRHIRDGFATIRDGDYVVVERENHDLREMTCKKLQIESNGDFLLVSESSNPKHANPIRVKRSVDDAYNDIGINILGKLVRAVVDYERK
jgi:SOS-response transcriptional repressor LexA